MADLSFDTEFYNQKTYLGTQIYIRALLLLLVSVSIQEVPTKLFAI